MWRWDSDPFGVAPPNQNPGGLGVFAYNLRYPGQYFDGETGLNYNYFRDLDPQTGRYVESDPIGLQGDLNTFAYVGASPITTSDPLGLFDPYNHNHTTRKAIAISGTSCANLPQAVALVDKLPGSQLPKNSFWHAMRDGTDPKETVDTARDKYNNYVNSQMAACNCDALAKALHAVQDSFPSGHTGFQPWDGGSWFFHFPGWSHLYHDMFPSAEVLTNAVDASAAMLSRYNKACPTCSNGSH
jgi:RHS repeat-associated protein